MTRPSLLAVVGPICQQPTPSWKTMAACIVGQFVALWWQFDSGVNQWSEHENTAREVNPRLSGDLFTPATLKVGIFLSSTVTQADAYLEKRQRPRGGGVSAHAPQYLSFSVLPVVIYLSQSCAHRSLIPSHALAHVIERENISHLNIHAHTLNTNSHPTEMLLVFQIDHGNLIMIFKKVSSLKERSM